MSCFPGGSEVKASASNTGEPVQSLDREDPLEKEMAIHSNILAWRIPWMENPMDGESHGRRSLVGYSPRGGKESTQLRDFTLTLDLSQKMIKTITRDERKKIGPGTVTCIKSTGRYIPHNS